MTEDALTGAVGIRALTETCGVAAMTRDVIVAEGPDTLKFLQSQLSQDVSGLAVGSTNWSFLLQPAGKLVGFFRITRTAEETFRLDADPGAGAGIEAALKRFLIRTKCVLALHESVPVWAVRGAALPEGLRPDTGVPAFPATPGFDVFSDVLPEALATEVPPVDARCAEFVRVAAGVPMFPYELNDSTIPNATGLVGLAVSFSKGCYVGQELVERIDSRGAMTPRVLRRISFDNVAASALSELAVGAELTQEGVARGLISSVAIEPDEPNTSTSRAVALAYVHRDTEPGGSLLCGSSLGVVQALGDW